MIATHEYDANRHAPANPTDWKSVSAWIGGSLIFFAGIIKAIDGDIPHGLLLSGFAVLFLNNMTLSRRLAELQAAQTDQSDKPQTVKKSIST